MRPVQIGPCTRCGRTLEHDQDPLTVLCGGCDLRTAQDAYNAAYWPPPPPPPMIDGRGREVPLYRASEPFAKLKPPPTVEWRPGNGDEGARKGPPAWLVSAMLFGSLGFIVGFLARGVA